MFSFVLIAIYVLIGVVLLQFGRQMGAMLLAKFYDVNFSTHKDNLYSIPWADMVYFVIGITIIIFCFEFFKRISERELHAANELKLIMERDDLLYKATQEGKNRICI